MKKIIKGVKLVIAIYKNSSDKYVPIYDGEYVVDFGKVAQQYGKQGYQIFQKKQIKKKDDKII